MAERWARRVRRWHELHAPTARRRRARLAGGAARLPDARRRLADRGRPARAATSRRRCARRSATRAGSSQNDGWEAAVKRFATGLLDARAVPRRLRAVRGARSPRPERARRIGQLVLRLTSPGVPDIYNGDELPYFALVDPDNRRPVDWDARRAALASRDAPHGESAKLHVIREALALRARRPEAFADGDYEPLARGRGHVRLSPRQRRRRRRSGARRRARGRPAARPVAQRARRASETRSAGTACCCSNGADDASTRLLRDREAVASGRRGCDS